jgi:uncharacterized protein YhaN
VEATGPPLALFDALRSRVTVARAAANRLQEIDRILAEIDVVPSGADAPALERELAELDAQLANLTQVDRIAFHERESARKAIAAVGGDAKAARIEAERATVLTEIRSESERYLRLRLGALAVREAIRRYRDQHRSSMLDAASEAFRTVSRGAYRGLAAQSAGGVEKLIAIAADGASKEASEIALSKGTRFQLYLALRVAGHREFARERTPLPFVLDDVMETFDDFRTEEAFRHAGKQAELGQVVCLTHHRHVAAIAREICPGVHIHDL